MQTNKKPKNSLQQLTKAVGDMVGISSGTTAPPTSTTAAASTGGMATTTSTTTKISTLTTNSTPATPSTLDSNEPTQHTQYKDYLTISGTINNTPLSEAASMEGDLSDDENIQLLDAGDGNINMIQLDDGSSAIICSEITTQTTDTLTQNQPQPQRVTRRTSSAKNSPLTGKKITTTPAGGGKRALPFSSPTKGVTQANKTARGSDSKPPSSTDESDGGMAIDPPTVKKKNSCPNEGCQQMKAAMEDVMQRLKKLEMGHTFLASSFDAYSASEMEQVQTLSNQFMAMDASVAQQKNDYIRLATQVGENGERIQVLNHDLQKAQQGVLEIAAKQDQVMNQWMTMKEQIQTANFQSRALLFS